MFFIKGDVVSFAEKILIVDDDLSIRRSYEKLLSSKGFRVETAKDGLEGYGKIGSFDPQLVLLDINMPIMNGLELLEKIKKENRDSVPVFIAITAYGDMDAALKAISFGAFDFLSKPISLEKLITTVTKAFERILSNERIGFLVDNEGFKKTSLIGRSPAMIDVYKSIASVASNKAIVLITGESGTGKEVVAKAVHNNSENKSFPFVPVNCAAIPSNLIESELMGYVKGSFTGADSNRKGKLAAADEGTLFLDEISEMPLEFQAKLLRILQEREYYPIGGSEAKKFKGRIIAATNRNLTSMVSSGLFREDLFYRLNVITLSIPPLRQRKEDIDLLAAHFIKKSNHDMGTTVEGITIEALDLLKSYEWPGNVRELENIIIKTAIGTKNPLITREEISPFIVSASNGEKRQNAASAQFAFSNFVPLRELEKDYISYVLQNMNWHKGKSVAILGITRPTLDKKIEEYGLKKNDFSKD